MRHGAVIRALVWRWLNEGWQAMQTAWSWLGVTTNSQPLQVILTLLGVLVAASGVWVAWKYVKVTRELAIAAYEQAIAANKQALSARDQADVTRRVFETGDRPYLEPAVGGFQYQSPDSYFFSFSLTNHGHVPATLVGWRIEVRIADELSYESPLSSAERAVFPGTTDGFGAHKSSPGQQRSSIEAPLQIDLIIEYRGPHETTYTTRLIRKRANSQENWVSSLRAT